jgi:hypothetical protein
MRLDARRATPLLVLALVACAGGAAPRPEETSTQSTSTAAPSGASAPSVPAQRGEPSTEEPSTEEPSTEEPSTEEPSTEEPSTEEPSTEEPAPGASAEPSPTYSTRVWFDLRSLPHRGPRDVDPRLVSGRVELLAQRVRDAAGEPPPRILVSPGASVFHAEFFGTEAGSLAQCQRALEVVTALRDVRATPCERLAP